MKEILREKIITRKTKSSRLKQHYGGHKIIKYDHQPFKKSYNISRKPKWVKVGSILTEICISTALGLCCSQGALFPDRLLEDMLVFCACGKLNDSLGDMVEVPDGAYIKKSALN